MTLGSQLIVQDSTWFGQTMWHTFETWSKYQPWATQYLVSEEHNWTCSNCREGYRVLCSITSTRQSASTNAQCHNAAPLVTVLSWTNLYANKTSTSTTVQLLTMALIVKVVKCFSNFPTSNSTPRSHIQASIRFGRQRLGPQLMPTCPASTGLQEVGDLVNLPNWVLIRLIIDLLRRRWVVA